MAPPRRMTRAGEGAGRRARRRARRRVQPECARLANEQLRPMKGAPHDVSRVVDAWARSRRRRRRDARGSQSFAPGEPQVPGHVEFLPCSSTDRSPESRFVAPPRWSSLDARLPSSLTSESCRRGSRARRSRLGQERARQRTGPAPNMPVRGRQASRGCRGHRLAAPNHRLALHREAQDGRWLGRCSLEEPAARSPPTRPARWPPGTRLESRSPRRHHHPTQLLRVNEALDARSHHAARSG